MKGTNLPSMARVIVLNSLIALTPNTAIGYTFFDNGSERIVLNDVLLPTDLSIDKFLVWCSDTMKLDIKFVDSQDYQRDIESHYFITFKASLEEIDLVRAVALQKETCFEQMLCVTGYTFKADNKQSEQSCSWIIKTEAAVYHLQYFDNSKPEEVIAFVHDALSNSKKRQFDINDPLINTA